MSGGAVCVRCGGRREDAFAACPDCGFAPSADERPLSWLFSAAWLDDEELAEAARRITLGQRPDPSRRALLEARAALAGAPVHLGPPLAIRERVALLLANVLLTPLAGYAVWIGLREERPAAARDALVLTVPITALLALLWFSVVFLRF